MVCYPIVNITLKGLLDGLGSGELISTLQHWWGQVSEVVQILGTIFVVITCIYGTISGFLRYFVRPFRVKTFLAGQWRGQITCEGVMTLRCEMTLYLRDGELTGSVFYEGTKGTARIKGFDRLRNNSDNITVRRSHGFWPPAFNVFDVQMSRDIHHDPTSDSDQDGIAEIYLYQMSVVKRYDPRIRCVVETKRGADQVEHKLIGQFTKPKGG